MDSTPPAPNRISFSQVLRMRLIEDACLRADAGQLRTRLEEARAAADQARQETKLSGRLLAAIGRRKGGPRTPEETAEIFASEKSLQRQYEEIDKILQCYTEDLNTLITMHLQETMPEFLAHSMARQRLLGWEAILKELGVDVRKLIKALGQARNSAVAGYNKSTRTLSPSAVELFDRAGELIQAVDARVKLANDKAAELGNLPGVAMIPLESAVKNLTKLDIGTMQKEFDRLTRELESFEQKQLAELQAPAVTAAKVREAQALAYVSHYREELRAFSDQQMKPEDMIRAIPVILERFRRR